MNWNLIRQNLIHLGKNPWSLFAVFSYILLALIEANTDGDFSIFISASTDLIAHENIYTNTYKEYYHYFYDINFALIVYPLSFLPLYFSKLIWLLINGVFLFRIWSILTSYLPENSFSKKGKILFTFICVIFIFRVLQANIHLIQVSVFLLYLTLESLYQIQINRKYFLGSFLLALGISIKLLPLIFIPYLVYRAEWKSLIYTLVSIVFLLFIPSLIIGFDFNLYLLNERWHLINPVNKQHILDTEERSFHSLTTLISTYFHKNTGEQFLLSSNRTIVELSVDQIAKIITIVRLFFIGFTLYFLQTLPFKKTTSLLHNLYEIAYICAIIPLIFPHQQHYAFFFYFPLIVYLVFFYKARFIDQQTAKKMPKILFIFFFSLSYLAFNCHFILGAYREIYDHYKILTYGALLLIVLLTICNPKKIQSPN